MWRRRERGLGGEGDSLLVSHLMSRSLSFNLICVCERETQGYHELREREKHACIIIFSKRRQKMPPSALPLLPPLRFCQFESLTHSLLPHLLKHFLHPFESEFDRLKRSEALILLDGFGKGRGGGWFSPSIEIETKRLKPVGLNLSHSTRHSESGLRRVKREREGQGA